jgi:hypothetical protein
VSADLAGWDGRISVMARPSLLDNEPELIDKIAEAYVDGKTNAEIAALIERGVHPKTITTYRRDPRVKKVIRALTEERWSRITRKIDSVLEERLRKAQNLDTETLLKIRKEILPERIQITDDRTNDRQSILDELMDATDSDPEAADAIVRAVESAAEKE